jgi:Pyruvate/2-oxoacid:ferredoxin oxidoreductase delta subunit
MKRQMIKIDESLCNGCGVCVPNCHEGALQIVDGKARLISDLFCDGLGACIGHCPLDAISFEEREAEAYDERRVMEENILPAGRNTIIAHLRHLYEHNEHDYFKQGVAILAENDIDIPFEEILGKAEPVKSVQTPSGGCPGSKSIDFGGRPAKREGAGDESGDRPSELRQWPVQMHLVSPSASYFKNSDLLLASDCAPFAVADFHRDFLKGKSLAIACPKLDSNKEVYVQKLVAMIDEAKLNTITVMVMEVPCCNGLLHLVHAALSEAKRKVPVKVITISVQGEVLSDAWI